MDNKSPVIVPVCLSSDIVAHTSSMSFPTKIRENNNTILKCENNMQQFYVINPQIRPIPAGMVLLCVQLANDIIMNITMLYDQYNTSLNCLRLIGWLIPTPYTTPLYVKKTEQGVFVSFNNSDYDGELVSTMYVLTDPRSKLPKLSGHKGKNRHFNIVDNQPEFLFGSIDNRIVPEPGGMQLEHLIPFFEKNLDNPEGTRFQPSLLGILNNRYGKKKTYIYVIMIVIFIVVVTIVILKMKK